jgi:hypothetical protein
MPAINDGFKQDASSHHPLRHGLWAEFNFVLLKKDFLSIKWQTVLVFTSDDFA